MQIYYVDNDLSTLNVQSLDGSGPTVIANSPQQAPNGLAIDHEAGKLYWSANGSPSTGYGSIYRSNLDGTVQEAFYTPSIPQGAGQVQIDSIGRRIYWLDRQFIRQMDLDGTNEAIFATIPFLGNALEFDATNRQLYFTTGYVDAAPKIERIDMDGSNRTVISNTFADSLALDATNQKIYAANQFDHTLMRVGFDGTGLEQIATSPWIRDVKVHDGHLYYPNVRSVAPDNTGPYFYQWVQSNLDGTNPVTLYEVPSLAGPRHMIQFEIVPEPSLCAVATAIFATALGKSRFRKHC